MYLRIQRRGIPAGAGVGLLSLKFCFSGLRRQAAAFRLSLSCEKRTFLKMNHIYLQRGTCFLPCGNVLSGFGITVKEKISGAGGIWLSGEGKGRNFRRGLCHAFLELPISQRPGAEYPSLGCLGHCQPALLLPFLPPFHQTLIRNVLPPAGKSMLHERWSSCPAAPSAKSSWPTCRMFPPRQAPAPFPSHSTDSSLPITSAQTGARSLRSLAG